MAKIFCGKFLLMIPSLTKDSPAPSFAEVALPLPLRQTFTYACRSAMQENVKLGARLLVPFGKRQLTGYTVALHQNLSEEIEIED